MNRAGTRPNPVPITATERIASFVLVVATTAGATFVILVGGSFTWIGSRIGYDAIAVGALVPWFLLLAARGRGLPSTQLLRAIVACLVVFAISTVTSRVPRISLEMLGYAVLLAGLYLGAVALLRRPTVRSHIAAIALVMCVGVCVLYLLDVLQAWQTWWGLVGRFVIPPLRPAYLGLNLGSPNPLAALVLLLLGFALGTVEFRGRPGAVAATLLIALVLVVVLLTASRGAWLGAAVALVVTGLSAWMAIDSVRRLAATFVRSHRGAVLVASVASLALAATGFVALIGRLTVPDESRQVFADISLRMYQSSPLTGTGPGTWPVLRATYTTTSQPDVYVPHAHSVYWQMLAELGLIGVVAGAVVAIAVGSLIIRALRSEDASRRRVAVAAVFAVVYLAVHQTVDMFMNVPAVLFAIGLPIAWLDATTESADAEALPDARKEMRRSRTRAVPLVAAAAIAVVGVGLFVVEERTARYLSAVDVADAGDWTEATTLALRAAQEDPDITAYQFTLGVAAANAGDMNLAGSALAKSAEADDYTFAWLDLAAVRWRLGDVNGARSALSRAERLGLQRPPVSLPAGWLRQQLGDEPEAIADYAAALSSAPTLAADPFWTSTPELRSAWTSVWSTVAATADTRTRLVLALASNRFDLATQSAASLADDDPALYELVVGSWEGDPDSWAGLQALAMSRPSDADTLAWCQLVAGHKHDQAAMDRYASWIAINGSPFASRSVIAQVTTNLARPMPASVVDGYELLYRRPVPAATIVEFLPQVAW